MTIGSPRPFWPIGSPRPPAEIWFRWKEMFMDYVNLVPLVNKVFVPEVIEVKLLRLCPSEHGQTTFDTRRLDEATTLDDALMHIWGTGEHSFTSGVQPLHETPVEFFFQHQLTYLLQIYASELTDASSMAVGLLKEEDSLTAVGEEVVMSHPRALAYAKAREESTRVIEVTGPLEDQPYECLSPSKHQWDDQFATCSVSVTYSHENSILIDQ